MSKEQLWSNDESLKSSEISDLLSDLNNNEHALFSDITENIEERDGVYYYLVKSEKKILEIHNKLKQTPKFSYLNDPYYDPDTRSWRLRGWNLPDWKVINRMKIPVPQQKEKRDITNEDFTKIVNNSMIYLNRSKDYEIVADELSQLSLDYLSKLVRSFAEKESGLWANSLYRYEKWQKAFSISRFHMMMNDWSEFKTAMNKLWITEQQIMTDIDYATTVFFAGIYEKAKWNIWAAQNLSQEKLKWKDFLVENFTDGFGNFMRQENIFNLARRYNGLDDEWRWKRYAEEYVEKFFSDNELTVAYDTIPNKENVHTRERFIPWVESRELQWKKSITFWVNNEMMDEALHEDNFWYFQEYAIFQRLWTSAEWAYRSSYSDDIKLYDKTNKEIKNLDDIYAWMQLTAVATNIPPATLDFFNEFDSEDDRIRP